MADKGAPALLGVLLDGSVEQIGAAGGDARRMDRQAVHQAADVWVHNTFGFVRAAAAASHRRRERRARATLRWLADLGTSRQDWIRERAAASGLRVAPGWLPPARGWAPTREPGLFANSPYGDLTPGRLRDIAAGYDLAAAEVRVFRVERAGDRLDAHVTVTLPRAYPTTDPGPKPATLTLALRDVTRVRFDIEAEGAEGAAGDGRGAGPGWTDEDVRAAAAVGVGDDARGIAVRLAPGEVALRLGTGGELRAAACDFFSLDDWRWYESAAGRRAAASAPRREPRRVREPRGAYLAPEARAAATVLRTAMLEARGVLSPFDGHRTPLADIHRAFAGAGTALLAAGAEPTRRRREAAFRALVETWVRRAGPALEARLVEALTERLDRPDLLAAHPSAPPAVGSAIEPALVTPPSEAELRCAWYEAEHVEHGVRRDAYAVVHLAVPPDGVDGGGDRGSWRMRGLRAVAPGAFSLRTEVFAGPVRSEVGDRGLVLGGGEFIVTAPEGWDGDAP